MSRFASLKSEYERLKLNYGSLSAIYERLKHGSVSEASRLLERIRREDEIPGLATDKFAAERPENDLPMASFDMGSGHGQEEPQAGLYARLGRATSSRPKPPPEVDGMPQWRGPIDPNLTEKSERHSGSSVSPSMSQHLSLNNPQTNEYRQKDRGSNISMLHRVLLWPKVVSQFEKSELAAAARLDLQYIAKLGSPWLLQKKTPKHWNKLPCNIGLPSSTSYTGSVAFPSLTVQQVNELSSAYFRSFNVLLPLLDMDLFMDKIVSRLLQDGYRNDDPESVLALLVFALGQLAIEGSTGKPTNSGNISSFCGGTSEKPPGISLFNEARRRIGMVSTQPCLENVQIMLLQATYFESGARHLNFWGSTSAASSACICLIKSQQIDWTSRYGDSVKRAYWICVLQERLFDLDFRVASSGIESLEDQIPLPHFHEKVRTEGSPGWSPSGTHGLFTMEEHDDSAFYFSAMITLSRILRRANDILHCNEPDLGESEPLWQESDTLDDASRHLLCPEAYGGPPEKLTSELLQQLDGWRDALPQPLQWSDDHRFEFLEVEPLTEAFRASFFSSLRNIGPGQLDHNVDIEVAQLRSRFYHARFLICQPLIYKALHSPKLMTADDRTKCAFAIDAARLWPLSLSPPKNKKHLIPHLFSWTQNFLAMTVVLRMCQISDYLAEVCKEQGTSERDIESAINAMNQWLEEVRQVDGIADWGIRVVGPAFSV